MDTFSLDIQGLEHALSTPSAASSAALSNVQGPIAILGAGGKMGPTLSMMIKKAAPHCAVYSVSRFTDQEARHRLDRCGINTVAADLLQPQAYLVLPPAEVVFYLLGMKFGASGDQARTWAINAYAPCLAAHHYRDAQIIALSTGNVYPFVPIDSGGATEQTPLSPIGEYAQSCVARERMFEFFSRQSQTPVTLVRLNYANEPRYGIIVDLIQRIMRDQPVDLSPGAVNLIWQRDALDYIIQSLAIAQSPPAILNVTGPDTIPMVTLAEKIGARLQKKPTYQNESPQTALLSNASRCIQQFGPPATSLDQAIDWIAQWTQAGMPLLDKPTRFEVRDGRF